MELRDFLLARIAEDEAVARAAAAESGGYYGMTPAHAKHIARHDPARDLVDCEAKQRIVKLGQIWDEPETHGPNRGHVRDDDYAHGVRHAVEVVLLQLALPYADHPDYREEWRP